MLLKIHRYWTGGTRLHRDDLRVLRQKWRGVFQEQQADEGGRLCIWGWNKKSGGRGQSGVCLHRSKHEERLEFRGRERWRRRLTAKTDRDEIRPTGVRYGRLTFWVIAGYFCTADSSAAVGCSPCVHEVAVFFFLQVVGAQVAPTYWALLQRMTGGSMLTVCRKWDRSWNKDCRFYTERIQFRVSDGFLRTRETGYRLTDKSIV